METTLTAGQAAAIAKALGPAIAKGKDRPALLGVAWGPDGTLSATDGYRAHVVTVPELACDYAPAVLSGADFIAALKASAKDVGRNGLVSVNVDTWPDRASTVTVAGSVVSVAVPVLTCDPVNLAPILAGSLDGETVLPASFDPGRFADLVTAAGAIGDTVRIVKIHDKQPARVESSGDGMTFTGVLMPQRVAH